MKKTDKTLTAIVFGVIVLIGAAFIIAFIQPEPTYQSEDNPEGVVHNYLLAIQKKDYERALNCIAPVVPGKPITVNRFAQNIERYSYYFRTETESISLNIVSTTVDGTRATVKVRETTFYQEGLFGSSESNRTFDVLLIQYASTGKWMITNAESYWAPCWNHTGGCQ